MSTRAWRCRWPRKSKRACHSGDRPPRGLARLASTNPTEWRPFCYGMVFHSASLFQAAGTTGTFGPARQVLPTYFFFLGGFFAGAGGGGVEAGCFFCGCCFGDTWPSSRVDPHMGFVPKGQQPLCWRPRRKQSVDRSHRLGQHVAVGTAACGLHAQSTANYSIRSWWRQSRCARGYPRRSSRASSSATSARPRATRRSRVGQPVTPFQPRRR